jgi:hypothetical protein
LDAQMTATLGAMAVRQGLPSEIAVLKRAIGLLRYLESAELDLNNQIVLRRRDAPQLETTLSFIEPTHESTTARTASGSRRPTISRRFRRSPRREV